MGLRELRRQCAVACALLAVAAGCGTLGGQSQFQRAVYSTHNAVQKLDKDLGASVTKLNETTAELNARIEASDVQMRGMQSRAEENQVKLTALQTKLDQLTATLYQHLNLSPPDASGKSSVAPPMGVNVKREDVTVLTPSQR